MNVRKRLIALIETNTLYQLRNSNILLYILNDCASLYNDLLTPSNAAFLFIQVARRMNTNDSTIFGMPPYELYPWLIPSELSGAIWDIPSTLMDSLLTYLKNIEENNQIYTTFHISSFKAIFKYFPEYLSKIPFEILTKIYVCKFKKFRDFTPPEEKNSLVETSANLETKQTKQKKSKFDVSEVKLQELSIKITNKIFALSKEELRNRSINYFNLLARVAPYASETTSEKMQIIAESNLGHDFEMSSQIFKLLGLLFIRHSCGDTRNDFFNLILSKFESGEDASKLENEVYAVKIPAEKAILIIWPSLFEREKNQILPIIRKLMSNIDKEGNECSNPINSELIWKIHDLELEQIAKQQLIAEMDAPTGLPKELRDLTASYVGWTCRR